MHFSEQIIELFQIEVHFEIYTTFLEYLQNV